MKLTNRSYHLIVQYTICSLFGLLLLFVILQSTTNYNIGWLQGNGHVIGASHPLATATRNTVMSTSPSTEVHGDWVDLEPLLRVVPTDSSVAWGDMYCQHEYSSTCTANYHSNEEPVRVATYYKDLVQQGWTLLHEETFTEGASQDIGVKLQLVKLNSSPNLPTRLHLLLLLQNEHKVGAFVMAWLEAWPDANKPPLYSGAKQVEVKWEKHPTFDFPQRVISYLVDASKEDVLDYYRHRMVRDGWDFEGFSDFQIGFSFSAGPDQGIGGSAIIDVQPVSSNDTKVQVTTHGGEVAGPDEVEPTPASDSLLCQPICPPTLIPSPLSR